MHVILKSDSVTAALDTIVRVTGAEHVNMHCDGKNLFLTATNNSKSIRLHIDGEIKSAGEGFSFHHFILSKLLRGRQELELKVVDGVAKFKSNAKGSRFSGDFPTTAYTEIDIEPEQTNVIELTSRQIGSLRKLIDVVSLSDPFSDETPNLFVRSGKEGMFATVFDNYHLAFAHDASAVSKQESAFNMALPLFNQIVSVAGEADFTLTLGAAYVYATSIGFSISLPMLQINEAQNFDQARKLCDDLLAGIKKTDDQITITSVDLSALINAMSAVSDQAVPYYLTVPGEGKVQMSTKTSFGSATETRRLAAKKWESGYMLNPPLLTDLIGVMPTAEYKFCVPKSVANGRIAVLHATDGTTQVIYTCLLAG